MTVYHPHSGIPPRIDHFEDYGHDEACQSVLVDCDPTSRFGSRTEFNFAELVLQASLNRQQIDRLLDVVDEIRNGAPFTFRKHSDIEKAWDIASRWHAPVCLHVVQARRFSRHLIVPKARYFGSVQQHGIFIQRVVEGYMAVGP